MRVDGTEETLELMVNCKTYPAVSKKYIETVCTGGITADGRFIRLYPVPFRLLDLSQQYGRWDVIRVKVYQDSKDSRPESYHLEQNTRIEIVRSIKTDRERWDWMRQGIFESTSAMEAAGRTNGLVEIVPGDLYWEPDDKAWSEGQLTVINQGNLFHNEVISSLTDRVPWQFRLRFREKSTGRGFDQKVLQWSYYTGYRRNLALLGSEKAALEAVRKKVLDSILSSDRSVYAIFGTHSRFGMWMISGLYHLPSRLRDEHQLRLV